MDEVARSTQHPTMLQSHNHDRASLLAGELHTVLERLFLKGRYIYHLLWYLSDADWPAQNFGMLDHALQQTDSMGGPMSERTWREAVRQRIQAVAWDQVVADVRLSCSRLRTAAF